jgi:GR25 family glycosyltransferase involved in LPS biosynthesis
MELIILDDSESSYPFDISQSNIRYIHEKNKKNIWEKRNTLNELAKGDIIICMDDDDIYFNERVTHTVEILEKNIKICLSGTHLMYIYCLEDGKLYLKSNRSQKHILNATYGYKRKLLERCKYKSSTNNLNYGEELSFTNNFTENVATLEAFKTTICIHHKQNTVNKDKFCKRIIDKSIPNFGQYIKPMYDVNPMVYWINLDVSKDRYSNMISQLGEIYSKRIPGVSTNSIKHYTQSTVKELNCFLSHMNALNEFVCDKKRDFCVIVEDDINLGNTKNFYEIIFYYMMSCRFDWDILQLHSLLHKSNSIKKDNEEWIKWKDTDYSTLIYIIKKDAARKIIQKYSNKDIYKSFVKKIVADYNIYSECKTYTLKSNLYFNTCLQFKSNINENHKDFHIENYERINASIVKNVMYPFTQI